VTDAFYVVEGDRVRPSELTRGPWDPNAQHAGPPSALLGREIERCEPREGMRVGRVTIEILAPVPIAPLTVGARVARPGRNVEMLEASLEGPDGEVMRARAWRLAAGDVTADWEQDEPPPGPEDATALEFFATGERVGWHTAMEIVFARGKFLEPGPATVWMRPRVALVEGEQFSPLQRALVAADGGNGVSAPLDWSGFIFINTDLSVHLLRPPEGEWVCLDAVTHVEGLGMTDTALWDERGRIGRAAQTLLVRARS
jgi:acyl-Coa thioesterase superfamily protein/acyl-CoA thioesterase superfamily protein